MYILKDMRHSKLWWAIWMYIILIYSTLPIMRHVLNFVKEHLGRDHLLLIVNISLLVPTVLVLIFVVRKGLGKILWVSIPLAATAYYVYFMKIPEERVHFLQYGLLGILVLTTVKKETWEGLLMALTVTVLVGCGDEFIQWLLPNRVGEIRDVMINAAASVLGVWFGRILFWE
jgi:VanZ family protein